MRRTNLEAVRREAGFGVFVSVFLINQHWVKWETGSEAFGRLSRNKMHVATMQQNNESAAEKKVVLLDK